VTNELRGFYTCECENLKALSFFSFLFVLKMITPISEVSFFIVSFIQTLSHEKFAFSDIEFVPEKKQEKDFISLEGKRNDNSAQRS
jgi:hypothetical protein